MIPNRAATVRERKANPTAPVRKRKINRAATVRERKKNRAATVRERKKNRAATVRERTPNQSASTRRLTPVTCIALLAALLTGCEPNETDKSLTVEERFAHLAKVDFTVGTATVRAWIAEESRDVTNGLMHVDAEGMAPYPDAAEKGMFFKFDRERSAFNGFWMRNVPIPLDIAFLKADGRIVTLETMAPFDERLTRPSDSYRYALEVSAGLLKKSGLKTGDTIPIPDAILNSTP
jgi:uncharacterized membrane protein (UPF0127 family)